MSRFLFLFYKIKNREILEIRKISSRPNCLLVVVLMFFAKFCNLNCNISQTKRRIRIVQFLEKDHFKLFYPFSSCVKAGAIK